jgi:hypothetical protein
MRTSGRLSYPSYMNVIKNFIVSREFEYLDEYKHIYLNSQI